MSPHNCTIREDWGTKYRGWVFIATCTCGWSSEAPYRDQVERIMDRHLRERG